MSFVFKEEHVFPAVIPDIIATARKDVAAACAKETDGTARGELFYKDLTLAYKLSGHAPVNELSRLALYGEIKGQHVVRSLFAASIESAARIFAWSDQFLRAGTAPEVIDLAKGPLFVLSAQSAYMRYFNVAGFFCQHALRENESAQFVFAEISQMIGYNAPEPLFRPPFTPLRPTRTKEQLDAMSIAAGILP